MGNDRGELGKFTVGHPFSQCAMDTMVPVIQLKTEVETITRILFSIIFIGALGVHLVAEEYLTNRRRYSDANIPCP